MGYVFFDLTQSGNCAGMAPAPIAGGGFGNAHLPPGMVGPATYIIVNTNTNNRYIGISSNIANRFNTRMATITEMGFANNEMALIGVTWGATQVRNTLPAVVGGGWPAPGMGWLPAIPAPPAPFTVMIDGFLVNLEQLLIRYVITQLGAGGTVSNNVMAAVPYVNPTPNPITVRLDWGAMNGLFVAGSHQSIWPAGVGW